MKYSTPLRYPGGKSKIAGFMQKIFKDNSICGGDYVEPYTGGGGVAFFLLFGEFAKHIHINDLNPAVYAFWKTVLEDSESLCKLIWDTPVTMDEWNKQKLINKTLKEFSCLEVGFSMFFLNRTNRSGILGAGVIGGKAQAGEWKMDARFNKKDLIKRIEKIANLKSRITLYNKDAEDLLRNVVSKLPEKGLVYLDPPYYKKGQALYDNYYTPDDHARIAKIVTKIKQNWIVSYDNTPEITSLYKGYPNIKYNLSYSAANRYKGSELMVFDKRLTVPSVENPTQIKAV